MSLIDIPEVFFVPEPIPPLDKKVALLTNIAFAAAFWFGEDDNEPVIEIRIGMRAPDGKIADEPVRAEIGDKNQAVNTSARFILDIASVQFRGLGVYELVLDIRAKGEKKWKRVSSYPFVMAIKPVTDPTAPEQPSAQTPVSRQESS